MRERLRNLPRSTRVAAVLMVVVPVALWLLLVWDTRPYSGEEIEADRARVEALPAYERAVEDCSGSWSGAGSLGSAGYPGGSNYLRPACEQLALAEHSSITREGLSLGAGASLWVTLGLAAQVFVIGTRRPTGAGVRGFAAKAGGIFTLGTVTALMISLVWWWGLESIAEHRRLENTKGPEGVALRASVLVGLAGVVGLACAQLLRGMAGRVVSLSAAAVALGLVVLIARPVGPWLPVLNVRAFLLGGASYDIPRDQVECTPSDERWVHWLTDNLATFETLDTCTPDHRTRTTDDAAAYLFGGTFLLMAGAGVTRVRRRPSTPSG